MHLRYWVTSGLRENGTRKGFLRVSLRYGRVEGPRAAVVGVVVAPTVYALRCLLWDQRALA